MEDILTGYAQHKHLYGDVRLNFEDAGDNSMHPAIPPGRCVYPAVMMNELNARVSVFFRLTLWQLHKAVMLQKQRLVEEQDHIMASLEEVVSSLGQLSGSGTYPGNAL